jgi:chorismate mutase-like protein
MNRSAIRKTIGYFLFLLFCVISAQCPAAETQTRIEEIELQKKVDEILLLVQKRLAIMHEVARTKWNQNLAIEDIAREQQLLTDLVGLAGKKGLDEKWTRQFFQAQFDAAKMIQSNDFALWQLQGIGKFESTLDLKQQLRGYIDQLNQGLMEHLSLIHPEDGKCAPYVLANPISTRASDQIDKQVWETATAPLKD